MDFGKTHNLNYILELCIEQDKEFRDLSVGKLTEYAISVRYPDDFYSPTVEEARESEKIAGAIKVFVLKKLKIDEKDINAT